MRNFLILVVLFITACSKGDQKIPADVIPKEKMTMILTDVHLAEAAITLKSINAQPTKDYSGPQYEYVYKLHHIDKEKFVKSMKYYSSHPKDLEELYTEVLNELSKRQATGGK